MNPGKHSNVEQINLCEFELQKPTEIVMVSLIHFCSSRHLFPPEVGSAHKQQTNVLGVSLLIKQLTGLHDLQSD